MRKWMIAMTVLAMVLGALGWCSGALSGDPAILTPPSYEPESMPYLIAAFMISWLALVTMFTYADCRSSFRHEGR